MADHVYKPHEVPKGERWQYFKDYYLRTTIFVVLALWAAISLLKTTVFSPKPDVYILATYLHYVDPEAWEEAKAELETFPFDYNEDKKVLFDFNDIHMDRTQEKENPEFYMAMQNKLMASLSTADYALQIVDEETFASFTDMELIGTYGELPDTMGHAADEIIKIPLKELKPFNTIENLPDGLYMTLRPRMAMQLRDKEKKIKRYENQIQSLLYMMEP